MKLVRSEGQFEIEGQFEELANTLALWHAEDTDLYEELFSQIVRGEWLADIPPDICLDMVKGTGLKLLNDDGTPASPDTVVSLGRRAWERLQEIVGMEAAEEL
jgi:hypothetical protein